MSLSISILFLRSCKTAKVMPLFKNGYKTVPQNYCPISPLQILSKIIGRIIKNQTQESLSRNKILYIFQSGLRKNYPTNICFRHLTDKITSEFEKGLFTGMVLIDIQKAFDTIDHQILIQKLNI